MKYILVLIFFIILSFNVYAVSNVDFNYEFNTSKSMVYSNILKDDSIVLNIHTDINSLYCKYSGAAGKTFDSMEGTFDFSFQDLHKKSFSYLDEGVHKLYVKCKNNTLIGQESELVFSIINPVKAEVILSKSSPISTGLVEITVKTTKQLSQKPTLSYSTDGNQYESIPLTGSNDLWTGYLIIPSTLKESIGSFKFRGIDLDGIVGEEITKGEIFLIDTVMPPEINEIDAESRDRDIYLEWRFNEDYSHFNIYRSKFSNVEYTDFYKSVDKKSFTDDDVDVGRLYYYRITAVDDAGNEGELSYEISSIAIKDAVNNSNSLSTGLDPELIGSVDSLLYDLDVFYDDMARMRSDLNSNSQNSEVISLLGLMAELDSSKKELESLQDEVSAYKEQKLTRVELDKKLSNARTKLGVVKKKSPESVSIISQTEFNKKYDESKINEVLLSMSKSEDEITSLIKKSKDKMDKNNFAYDTKIKNVQIYYADGSKTVKAVFVKDISFKSGNNGSIIEYIPKEVAESVSEITFKDNGYNVIKDDPIVSFPDATDQIVYFINKEVSLDSARKVETFFLSEESQVSANAITGMAIFENRLNSNSYIVLIIILLVTILGYYFIKSKKEKVDLELMGNISDKLVEAKLYMETKNKYRLDEIYLELNENYKKLSDKNKEAIYTKLANFNKQIKIIKFGK